MTVALHDATGSLSPGAQRAFQEGGLDVLLCADDALIIGAQQEHVQELLDAVARAGAGYGMELHWSEFQ
eukprot:960665-Pyramimonas_sp.AAC.1